MCPVSSQRIALILCVALNAISVHSAATNTWTAINAETAVNSQQPAQPQHQRQERLKVFQDGDSFQVSAADEQKPLLPAKLGAEEKSVLNTVIGGVYHNYRSSYVGNKVQGGTRLSNRNRLGALIDVDNQIDNDDNETDAIVEPQPSNEFENEIRYNVGPGVNISVDKNQELVSVFLDEDCLKDVFTGM